MLIHKLYLIFLFCHIGSVAYGSQSDQSSNQDKAPQEAKVAKGIDVSHFQGAVRWDLVKNSGIHFAFAKATGGMTYTDPHFENNWNGMREAGLLRGAYHFFYADDDPHQQAQHFIQIVGKLKRNDLPPVLDVEILDGVTDSVLVARVFTWLRAVEQAFGCKPILYTDPGFAKAYLQHKALGNYPLWIADYGVAKPGIPQAWQDEDWVFWQKSQRGKVEGVDGDVDLNVFRGDPEALMVFIERSERE